LARGTREGYSHLFSKRGRKEKKREKVLENSRLAPFFLRRLSFPNSWDVTFPRGKQFVEYGDVLSRDATWKRRKKLLNTVTSTNTRSSPTSQVLFYLEKGGYSNDDKKKTTILVQPYAGRSPFHRGTLSLWGTQRRGRSKGQKKSFHHCWKEGLESAE